MKWTRICARPVAVSIGLALAALSCSAPPLPEDAARGFWEAMRDGDPDRARDFVTDSSRPLLADDGNPGPIDRVLFGEVLRNETAAIVRTSMQTRNDDIDLNVVFHTHLVLVDDEWKVDYAATRQEVTRATFTAGMKLMGEAVGEAIEQGIEEFGQALEQGAAEVRDAVRDAIEDLGRSDDQTL